MLDSGASQHFTNNLKDYSTYRELVPHVKAITANGVVEITHKGIITLRPMNRQRIKLSPVLYMPGLTTRLISMGQLLQDGFELMTGNASAITLRKGSDLIKFLPRSRGDTIYQIVAWLHKYLDVLKAEPGVDYNIMHRRFGHPSRRVLNKAQKHTKGFPNVDFSHEEPICPGCTKGKMHQQSYPPSAKCATAPFELIHSDLKSFPIKSYHHYKYVITFFDDFISHA